MAPSPPASRGHTLAILGLLVLQFLAGMSVNLFVVVPKGHPGTASPDYFAGVVGGASWALIHGPGLLQLHVLVALMLGIMAVAHLVLAVRRPAFARWTWSALGLFGLICAAFNGASFLNYGANLSSMLMSSGFAIALVGYGMGLLASPAATPGPTSFANGAASPGN